MWSDSQTVLAWIKNTEKSYKTVISTRIGEILESTTKNQWRWIPSDDNPADEATKLIPGGSKIFNGPKCFNESPDKWPVSGIKYETDEGLKVHMFVHKEMKVYKSIDERDFSDWWRLVKRLCILRQFGSYILESRTFQRGISYANRKAIEYALFRKAQWDAFPEEMDCLINLKTISEKSALIKFNPFMDDHGVMRSGGRLQNATGLPQRQRVPIILPQHHHITRLIVKSAHERYLHQGNNTVLGALQQEFWIINARAVLKNVKKCCQKCILSNSRPTNPMMAPLPECRTKPDVLPFTNTGVDYFGPFEVLVNRSKEKRWGAIFTCLSTRAVHIEMAEKLNTDSFIMCFRNFQNIRGKVNHLYSDNGTNFVGANNEMLKLVNEINKRMGAGEAAKLKVYWTFNPPAASHFGGAWERLIRIIKDSLKVLLNAFGTRTPRPETLRSSLIEASAILNRRPLTHIPIDSFDDEVLTPFHFLILRDGDYVPPRATSPKEYDRNHWCVVQNVIQHFWNRWKKEYIPTLVKRNKWTKLVEPLEVDDIVIITDDDVPKDTWLKGRILEVRKAKDGQVRSVKIKTANGIFVRPSVKVAYLDVTGAKNKTGNKPDVSESIMHHEELTPSPQPSVKNRLFPNWGKHREVDVEAIKRKAEEINSPQSNKRLNSTRTSSVGNTFARTRQQQNLPKMQFRYSIDIRKINNNAVL